MKYLWGIYLVTLVGCVSKDEELPIIYCDEVQDIVAVEKEFELYDNPVDGMSCSYLEERTLKYDNFGSCFPFASSYRNPGVNLESEVFAHNNEQAFYFFKGEIKIYDLESREVVHRIHTDYSYGKLQIDDEYLYFIETENDDKIKIYIYSLSNFELVYNIQADGYGDIKLAKDEIYIKSSIQKQIEELNCEEIIYLGEDKNYDLRLTKISVFDKSNFALLDEKIFYGEVGFNVVSDETFLIKTDGYKTKLTKFDFSNSIQIKSNKINLFSENDRLVLLYNSSDSKIGYKELDLNLNEIIENEDFIPSQSIYRIKQQNDHVYLVSWDYNSLELWEVQGGEAFSLGSMSRSIYGDFFVKDDFIFTKNGDEFTYYKKEASHYEFLDNWYFHSYDFYLLPYGDLLYIFDYGRLITYDYKTPHYGLDEYEGVSKEEPATCEILE